MIASRIKAKNTTPELRLRRRLWKEGLRGYRLHPKNIPGRPDICFTRYKVAVFVHGCYWHRCSKCNLTLPKSNSEFWKEKFDKNVKRDEKKADELKEKGFAVVVCWECDIKKQIESCIIAIKKALNESNCN